MAQSWRAKVKQQGVATTSWSPNLQLTLPGTFLLQSVALVFPGRDTPFQGKLLSSRGFLRSVTMSQCLFFSTGTHEWE